MMRFGSLLMVSLLVGCNGGAKMGTGGSGGGGGGGGGNGNMAPPPPVNGVQIAGPELMLMPGDEIFRCFYTSVASDVDIAAVKFKSTMTPGSHHFIVYTTQQPRRPDGTVEPCQGVGSSLSDIPVWLYSTQDPEHELAMPTGVAMPLKAHQALYFDMHYINTTQKPFTAQVWLNLEFATGSYQSAGAFVTYNTQISIPPNGGTQTVTGDCKVPAGVKFFTMSTHSHKRTTDAFAAGSNSGTLGQMLVHTTDWEHAAVSNWADPFVTFGANELLHYQCSYLNNTANTITQGESAEANEMCMAVGYYFPSTGTSFCLDSMTYGL